MTLALRLAGALLLILTGAGGGLAATAHADAQRQQCHAFARLLAYLAALLDAQALAAPELLARAARCAEFAAFCPADAAALSSLCPPSCLSESLRRELAETLTNAEEAPRLQACAALRRLAALCEDEAAARAASACAARRLWPKLGGCLGILTAILLW